MIQVLKDVFIGMLLLSGITFFGVLIWALIYTLVKMVNEEKRK